MELCPCGSGKHYQDCCQLLIKGETKALTAEALMRSRYTAYTKTEVDYIFNTTDPGSRNDYDHAGTKSWSEKSEWLGLEINEVKDGGENDSKGFVEFVASFNIDGEKKTHHEIAEFVKIEDIWYFKNGEPAKIKPVKREYDKIGRNDPCICGSGKKYKKCCG